MQEICGKDECNKGNKGKILLLNNIVRLVLFSSFLMAIFILSVY